MVAFFNENATIKTTVGSLLEVVARNLSELKPWYSEEGDRFRFPGRGRFTDQAREETVGSRRVRCAVTQKEEKSWATGSCPLFFLIAAALSLLMSLSGEELSCGSHTQKEEQCNYGDGGHAGRGGNKRAGFRFVGGELYFPATLGH